MQQSATGYIHPEPLPPILVKADVVTLGGLPFAEGGITPPSGNTVAFWKDGELVSAYGVLGHWYVREIEREA